jgi:hypothetical protein
MDDCNGGEGGWGEEAKEVDSDGGGDVEGDVLWDRGEPEVVGVEGVVADC